MHRSCGWVTATRSGDVIHPHCDALGLGTRLEEKGGGGGMGGYGHKNMGGGGWGGMGGYGHKNMGVIIIIVYRVSHNRRKISF